MVVVDEANERYDLDDAGRLALDVALGTAGAIGDDQCGTEYLLFGVIATAADDVAELARLFALDSLRIERAINKLRQHRYSLSHDGPGDPPFSPRAARAVRTRRADGSGPTGPFELLHGALCDNASGASQVLRELGVRPDEVRRLVGYGIRHLTPFEIETLIDSLNRRATPHRPWWGPDPRTEVDFVQVAETKRIIVAHSPSALAALDGVRVARYGFGFTLVLESLKPWMLDPVLTPQRSWYQAYPRVGRSVRIWCVSTSGLPTVQPRRTVWLDRAGMSKSRQHLCWYIWDPASRRPRSMIEGSTITASS